MQVYRGMDIGTAKPTLAEQRGIPHHLIDLVDPNEEFTVARYQRAFLDAITGIESRGTRALLVGGTALYLRAVVDGLTIPGRFPDVLRDLEQEADTPRLHERLTSLDPIAAARIEPGNRRRVLRALEVTIGSGRRFSEFGPGLEAHPPTRFMLTGLDVPRAVLDDRVAARLHAMLACGLVEEVRGLADLYVNRGGLSRTARQALGYREVLSHLEDGVPLEVARDDAVRRTRAFVRRQQAWFRRDPRIVWHAVDSKPLAVVDAVLGDWADRCRS